MTRERSQVRGASRVSLTLVVRTGPRRLGKGRGLEFKEVDGNAIAPTGRVAEVLYHGCFLASDCHCILESSGEQ